MTNPFVDFVLMRLHHLVKTKATGTPEELARKLDCSERTARHKIEQLREAGLPIAYCKQRHTYYYTEDVEVRVSLILGDKEMHKIVGGNANTHLKENFKNNFQTANFLPCENGNLFCDSRNTQNRNKHL